jgi:hypothetical protein
MKRLLSLALCVALLPAAALAQSAPAPMNHRSPSPQMKAMMDKMKAAKAALFAPLSPEHKAAVETAIGQLADGTLASPQAAIKQIDSVLTADEKTAVLAAHTKALADMHAMMAKNRGGAPGPARAPRPMRSGAPNMMNDAGAVLLGASRMGMMGGGRGFGGPMGMHGRGDRHHRMSPQMMAAMKKAHDTAKASALAALSASHRATVQTIVAQLAANKTGDRRAAGKAAAAKIDALLSSSEKAGVLAADKQMHTAMRASMQAAMKARMGANAPKRSPRPHPSMKPHTPDAGRALIGLLRAPMMHRGPGGPGMMRGGPPGGH